MMNYIKSEWYRMTHSKECYVFTGILAGLALLLNLVLYVFSNYVPQFRYGTVPFSLSFLASGLNILFLAGVAFVSVLYGQEKRNGLVKNAVSYGISREQLFIGKCIISAVVSICSMIVILVVFIGSAVLLLEPGNIEHTVAITLRGVASMIIAAIAYEVLAIGLYTICEKEMVSYVVWYIIMAMIPQISNYLGIRYEVFRMISSWMPYTLLNNEVTITLGNWNCLWETPEGFMKCMISGSICFVLFFVFGLLACKKQEIV